MEEIVSWPSSTDLSRLRDFPLSNSGSSYNHDKQIVHDCPVNVISVRPGGIDMMLPLQEIAIEPQIMDDMCEIAHNIGIKLWRGNKSHQDILR